MARLIYRQAARADLDAIYDFIAADSPERAARFIESILERCERLEAFPESGPSRDAIRPGLRILPLPGRSVVAYRLDEDTVTVMRVFYGGQDYEALLTEE